MEFETGQIICTAVDTGKTHDFKLLKRTRLPFIESQLCLADQGYQGFAQRHSGACIPTKKPRKQPLPKVEKQHNPCISAAAGTNRTRHSPLQDFSYLFRLLSQPQTTLRFAFKSDCWLAQLRTGTSFMIHAGGLIYRLQNFKSQKVPSSYCSTVA
ncbi:transposase [Funiculus sociatus]|uniref:transposase n=1 Tax=Funiculus sociatus TaxID=450527 RepID=UPI003D6483BB